MSAPTPIDIARAEVARLRTELAAAELALLRAALAATGGNRTHAARLLGVPLRTLHHHIARHPDIPPAPPNVPPQLRGKARTVDDERAEESQK